MDARTSLEPCYGPVMSSGVDDFADSGLGRATDWRQLSSLRAMALTTGQWHQADARMMPAMRSHLVDHFRDPEVARLSIAMNDQAIARWSALTMGDVAGIGPEVIAAGWADPRLHALARPLVIGDPAVLERALRSSTVAPECESRSSPRRTGRALAAWSSPA